VTLRQWEGKSRIVLLERKDIPGTSHYA
jgi:hypothetical protein